VRLFSRVDADEFAHAAAVAELDYARNLGEQCIVLTQADVGAGLDACAALAHDNGPAGYELAAEHFHAQALGIGIAAVFRTS